MRRLLTLAVSVTAMAALAPLQQASATGAPIGQINSISFSGANVTIQGWALDPAHPANSNTVLVTADSRAVGAWRTANISRPDVNVARHASGGHGFAIDIALTNGSHQVCVTTRPYNAGNPITNLGCATVNIFVSPRATYAQFRAETDRIDPKHTVVWSFSNSYGTEAGWAANNRVNISSALAADWLHSIVVHEWSHVLQYRAFGSNPNSMEAAAASFNAVAGTTGTYGIEHGADCMAMSLGATKFGYGCPANLQILGSRVAHGLTMTRPVGNTMTATVSGQVFRTTGSVFDPANPRQSAAVQITDHGKAVTGWIPTTGTSSTMNSTYGIPGSHGFSVAVQLTAGSHLLCVTGRQLTGTASVSLGCWTRVVS